MGGSTTEGWRWGGTRVFRVASVATIAAFAAVVGGTSALAPIAGAEAAPVAVAQRHRFVVIAADWNEAKAAARAAGFRLHKEFKKYRAFTTELTDAEASVLGASTAVASVQATTL